MKSHPACFLIAPGLVWQEALNKSSFDQSKIIHIHMLLMLQKGIIEWFVTLCLLICKS